MFFSSSKKQAGLSLMETLIVITLILLILAVLLFFINVRGQLGKGWDGKRKADLNELSKVFEDYYNDKNCYPKPEEVCVEGPITEYQEDNVYACRICGGSLSPYKDELPCDPEDPHHIYLYTVDDLNCPSFFVIYSKLSNEQDPEIAELGCNLNTCGPGDQGYNYAELSPNADLLNNICVESSALFCYPQGQSACNECGSGYTGQDKITACEQVCDLDRGLFTSRDDNQNLCYNACAY
ncbi:MAG: hypothetical protein KatS3mg090_0021 [Patescibacteria group bacterium]|nr:MAG: hypothetical protein KatS3mg090_0021 [Patescibacteria group bacterium]